MKNYTMGAVEANASAPHNLAQLGISYTIKDQSVCANGECVHVPLIDDTLCALRSSVLCIPSAPSISSATTLLLLPHTNPWTLRHLSPDVCPPQHCYTSFLFPRNFLVGLVDYVPSELCFHHAHYKPLVVCTWLRYCPCCPPVCLQATSSQH